MADISPPVNSQQSKDKPILTFLVRFAVVCTFVSFGIYLDLFEQFWADRHTHVKREIKMYGEWKILYWWPSIRTNWKRKIALQQFRPMIAMIYDNEATILLPLISENCVLEPFAVWICDVLMCDAMPCHANGKGIVFILRSEW